MTPVMMADILRHHAPCASCMMTFHLLPGVAKLMLLPHALPSTNESLSVALVSQPSAGERF